MQLRKFVYVLVYGAVLVLQQGCATSPSGFTPPSNAVDDDINNPLSGKSGG